MKPILISILIGGLIGWFGHGYLIETEITKIEVPFKATIQPPKETVKGFKETPIEVTSEKQMNKLNNDEDNGIHHRLFKSGGNEVYLTFEGELVGMKIDSVIIAPKPFKIDTVITYEVKGEKTDSVYGYKAITLVAGSTIAGYSLAKENYTVAGIVAGVTFLTVYFWDEILKIWRFL